MVEHFFARIARKDDFPSEILTDTSAESAIVKLDIYTL